MKYIILVNILLALGNVIVAILLHRVARKYKRLTYTIINRIDNAKEQQDIFRQDFEDFRAVASNVLLQFQDKLKKM